MTASSSQHVVRRISARLERDTRVNLHRSPISVRLEDSRVILEGEMTAISEKRAAVDCARRELLELKTYALVDRLHVKPVEHRQNLELKEEVAAALGGEPVFRDYTLAAVVNGNTGTIHDAGSGAGNITVTIENGCVTLAGRVASSSHKRLAEVLTWWTDGCRYVDNQLEVHPPEEDSDDDTTDIVRIVLEKDPLVHADQLSIGTAAGVVVMHGSVASREEKKLALLDAWYVPGVSDVVDHIESRD